MNKPSLWTWEFCDSNAQTVDQSLPLTPLRVSFPLPPLPLFSLMRQLHANDKYHQLQCELHGRINRKRSCSRFSRVSICARPIATRAHMYYAFTRVAGAAAAPGDSEFQFARGQ